MIGDEITEEDRVIYLLASLPESFNTLVTALEANSDVPRMEVVTERLLHEESKQNDSSVSNRRDRALAVRQRTSTRKNIKCYRCHKIEHMQRNCPNRERFEPEQDRTRSFHRNSSIFKLQRVERKQSAHNVQVLQSDSDSDHGLVTTSHVYVRMIRNPTTG